MNRGGLIAGMRTRSWLEGLSEMADSTGSVSYWIAELQRGQRDAATAIWDRFHQRLLRVAAKMLPGFARRDSDEEDIVNGAFHSFFRRIEQGEFPRLDDRNELWKLLSAMTKRKAINSIRRQQRFKRAGPDGAAADTSVSLEHCIAATPTPEWIAMERESIRELLEVLDEDLRVIAICRLNGFTNQEIATRIRRSVPTVERRLRLIRQKWEGVEDA